MNFISYKMQYFNIAHIAWLILCPVIILSVYFIFRHRSQKAKFWALMGMCIFNICLYLPYKFYMCIKIGSPILNELPLHLCSFNLILMPIALMCKNKKLFAYFYYIADFASLAGILFFGTIFLGQPMYSFSIIVYFIYHTCLIGISLLVVAFGIYRPKLFDVVWAYCLLIVFACVAHCINILFRWTGWSPTANYFVTMGEAGNIACDFLMKIIPLPLLYFLPGVFVIGGGSCLMWLLAHKIESKKLKNTEVAIKNSQLQENTTVIIDDEELQKSNKI